MPQVPLAVWGYGRYGVDLMTPALEMDIDYSVKSRRAEEELRGYYENIDFSDITDELNSNVSFLDRIERMNVFHLSWLTILYLAVAIPILILLLLLFLVILFVVRRRKKRKSAA